MPMPMRHREERSDAAIHAPLKSWIATAYGLAMTMFLSAASQWRCIHLRPRNDGSGLMQAFPARCHLGAFWNHPGPAKRRLASG